MMKNKLTMISMLLAIATTTGGLSIGNFAAAQQTPPSYSPHEQPGIIPLDRYQEESHNQSSIITTSNVAAAPDYNFSRPVINFKLSNITVLHPSMNEDDNYTIAAVCDHAAIPIGGGFQQLNGTIGSLALSRSMPDLQTRSWNATFADIHPIQSIMVEVVAICMHDANFKPMAPGANVTGTK